MAKLQEYSKFIIAILGAVGTGLATAKFHNTEADTIITAVTAFLVYFTPNTGGTK